MENAIEVGLQMVWNISGFDQIVVKGCLKWKVLSRKGYTWCGFSSFLLIVYKSLVHMKPSIVELLFFKPFGIGDQQHVYKVPNMHKY